MEIWRLVWILYLSRVVFVLLLESIAVNGGWVYVGCMFLDVNVSNNVDI